LSETESIQIRLNELHPGQMKVLSEADRFNVLCCGRRWGKTTLSEELLLSPDDDGGAIAGFPVAYFAPTYKMLMEVWRAMVETCHPIISKKSDAEKRIELYGGGIIDFWSLDNPDSPRGRKYKRVVIDEAAMILHLANAWNRAIRPTLTDLKGDAWFLSTPRGKANYFYELFKRPHTSIDWRSWQMPTVANPHIDPKEVDEAQLQLDPLTFAQEYLASFETDIMDAWAYCFDYQKHVGTTNLNRAYEVKLSFDFNRNPITCGVFQDYGNWIYGIEQIKLENSNIYALCDYINLHYRGCMFIVTGDATGKASSALVQDNLNYYTVIKNKLNLSNGQIRVHTVNPKIEENRVLVNSILHHSNVLLDKHRCRGLIFDLENAKVLPDGSLDKRDREDPTKQLDALDCFRYYLNTFFKHALKN
jgi:hypothetical protein